MTGRIAKWIVRHYLLWTPDRVAREEIKAGLTPSHDPTPEPPVERASYWHRAKMLCQVTIFLEIPLFVITSQIYHHLTWQHQWVKVIALALLAPTVTTLALTVVIGGGYCLLAFLYWVVTGIDPLPKRPEKVQELRGAPPQPFSGVGDIARPRTPLKPADSAKASPYGPFVGESREPTPTRPDPGETVRDV